MFFQIQVVMKQQVCYKTPFPTEDMKKPSQCPRLENRFDEGTWRDYKAVTIANHNLMRQSHKH